MPYLYSLVTIEDEETALGAVANISKASKAVLIETAIVIVLVALLVGVVVYLVRCHRCRKQIEYIRLNYKCESDENIPKFRLGKLRQIREAMEAKVVAEMI